jgi:hypothetical protein
MSNRTIPPIRATWLVFVLSATLLSVLVYLGGRNRGSDAVSRADLGAEVDQATGDEIRAALKLFGDDAKDLFVANRTAVHDLMAILRLEVSARDLSLGPWREAVIQWARAGRLGPYMEHLKRMSPEQWSLLHDVPGCLPLLGRGASKAETMLARHGARAWRLFLIVDFADDIEGVERVARALEVHGERMLRVNESHGPALAMLFVAPTADVAGALPRLFSEAIDRLGIEEAGALFLGNYDYLVRLVREEHRAPEDLVEAFDLLAGQPDVVRGLASDSGLVVRLLLERRARQPIGVEILSRCGPEAADLLFETGGYAGSPEGKPAAMAILARYGWSGVELLRAFRDDASWHRLLRRADLMDVNEEPLIVRLAGKLKTSGQRQDDINRYLEMPRAQILEEDIPPTLIGQVLEWVPGYTAAHTAYNAARGYHVETLEAAEAVFDGVTTITLVGKLAGHAIKTVGRQASQAAIRAVESQATRELAAIGGRQAAKTLMARLPGALSSLTRSFPMQLPTLNVTSIARSASGVAKKVGVRTWGKLDRRIIMRGDRKVVINLFSPEVVSHIGKELSDKPLEEFQKKVLECIQWKHAPDAGGEFSTCIMERVLPGLRIPAEDWAIERPQARTDPIAPQDWRSKWLSKLGDPSVSQSVEMVLMVVCLVSALSLLMPIVGRVFPSKSTGDRPRPYRE